MIPNPLKEAIFCKNLLVPLSDQSDSICTLDEILINDQVQRCREEPKEKENIKQIVLSNWYAMLQTNYYVSTLMKALSLLSF